MKCVSELYGRHPESDIYVIGTGASLRVFPTGFFDGKITIGLNMAWKTVPVRYGITIHPDLSIPEFIADETPHPEILWITKPSKCAGLVRAGLLTPDNLRYAEEHFYGFETDRESSDGTPISIREMGHMPEWMERSTPGRLYLWNTIASTGTNLAANLGARNIILVGCDNCALGGNHHAQRQPTRWLGASPNQRYHEYYEAAAEARAILRKRGVNLISLSPFLGLGFIDEDFRRLCGELDRPPLLIASDISPRAPSLLRQAFKKIGRTILGERRAARLKNRLSRGA